MYLMINAYDVLGVVHVRVLGTDEVGEDTAEAMHVGWRSSCTFGLPREREWPDVVALVAEAVLDMAYDRR